MFIFKSIMCLVILIIVPEILGLLVTRFMKNRNVLLNFLMGYIAQFAVLQLIAVPMIFLKLQYKVLLYSWTSIISILTIISFVINFKNIRKNIINFAKNFKVKDIFSKSNILVFLAVLLILTQVIVSAIFTHNDADDAFYIGTAVTTIHENNMYRVSPENGYYYGQIPSRYILSPFSIYLAIVSSIVRISPVIVAHSVLQPLFISLTYIVYILIAEQLFKKDKNDMSLFLIFLSIIFVFGNISTRTNFTVMFLRIWQGKAILANIILPTLWLIFSYCIKENNFINWFSMFLIILAGCLVSEMSLIIAPLSLMLLSFVFAVKDKKIKYILKSMACIIPCLIYLIIYIVIK